MPRLGWRRAARALTVSAGFVLLSLLGVVLHLNLPPSHRLLGQLLQNLINQEILGEIELARVTGASLSGLTVEGLRLRDPGGREVAYVGRLRVNFAMQRLMTALLLHREQVDLVVKHSRVEQLRLWLYPGQDPALPSLLDAVASRNPDSKSGTELKLWLPLVELADTSVHSELASLPGLAAELRRANAWLYVGPQGATLDLKRSGLSLEGLTRQTVLGTARVSFSSRSGLKGSFDGRLGEVPIALEASLRRDGLELLLTAPVMTPEAMRALWPDWPLRRTASMRGTARGHLPNLELNAELDAAPTTIRVRGPLNLGNEPNASLSLDAEQLDLADWFHDAPTSTLSVHSSSQLRFTPGLPTGRLWGAVEAGTVGGYATPRLPFVVALSPAGIHTELQLDDPAWRGKLSAQTARDGQTQFTGQLRAPELAKVSLAGHKAGVAGSAELSFSGELRDQQFTLDTTGNWQQPRVPGTAEAKGLQLSGRLTGELSQLAATRVNGEARVTGLKVQGLQSDQARVQFTGPLLAPRVSAEVEAGSGRYALTANAQLTPSPRLQAVRVKLTRDGQELVVTAKDVQLGSELTVQNLALTGAAGQLGGDFSLGPDSLHLRFDGQTIDLGTLSKVLALPAGLSGKLALDGELQASPTRRQGKLTATLTGAKLGTLDGFSGQVTAEFNGDQIAVSSRDGELAGLGRVSLTVAARVPHGLPPLAALRAARGTAQLELNDIPLRLVSEKLGLVQPRPELSGLVHFKLTLEQAESARRSTLTLLALTQGLTVTVHSPTGPQVLRGQEVIARASVDGESGALTSTVTMHRDGEPVLQASADLRLDPAQLASAPLETLRNLADRPLVASMLLPDQEFSSWLAPLGLTSVRGKGRAFIQVVGTPRHPSAMSQWHLEQLTFPGCPVPLDGDLTLGYDASKQSATFQGAVGVGAARYLTLPEQTVQFERRGGALDWNGRLDALFTALPLELVPGLQQRQVTGTLQGSVTLERHNGLSETRAALSGAGLHVGPLAFGTTLLSWDQRGDELLAQLHLFGGGQSVLDVDAKLPFAQAAPLPALDPKRAITLKARAVDFGVGVFRPLFPDNLGLLEGSVSGEMSGNLQPTQGSYATTLDGELRLSEGRITMPDLSLELTHLEARATARSDGSRTRLELPSIAAALGSAEPNLRGSAELILDDLSLSELHASIDQATEVPLTVNGVPLATLTGSAAVTIIPHPNQLAVSIRVRELEARLPKSTAKETVELEENPDLVLRQPLSAAAHRRAIEAATELVIELDLGTRSKVTKPGLEIPISGVPRLTLGRRASPSGSIMLKPGGRLQLLGKLFEVERGELRLDPEHPTNPYLDVTAQWRGPTHVVTLWLTGTREQATLRLTSDPPLASEAQIQALLLGGGPGNDKASAGVGLGAALFAEVLADTPLSRVELRTSKGDRTANYTAAVPLRDNLWFEATYMNPSTSSARPGSVANEPGFSGTVDWRFRQNWSLRTEIGNVGAGLDLLWLKRY